MPTTQEKSAIGVFDSFLSGATAQPDQVTSKENAIEVFDSFLKDEPIEKSLEVRLQERRAIQQTESDQLFQDARETEINTDAITTQPLKRHNQIRREHNLPPVRELPEELLGGRTISNLRGAISEFANIANRGVEGIADLTSALSELAGLDTFEEITGIPFGTKNVNEFFAASRNVIKAYLPDDPRLRDEYLSQLSRGVGGAAGFAAAGIAGGPGLLAGLALGSGAQEQAEAARAAQADETATAVATVLGAAVGATDIIPAGRYVRALKPIDRVMKGKFFNAILNKGGVLVDVVTEGLQEFGQEAGSNVIAKQILKQDRDLFEGAAEAGGVGAGVGGVLGAITRGLGKIAGVKIRIPRSAAKPKKTKSQLFAKDKPEAAERLRKSAVAAQKEKGKQGVPSKQDFAAEGLPDLSRKERAAFVKELSEVEEAATAKPVESVPDLREAAPIWLKKDKDLLDKWLSGELSDEQVVIERLKKAGITEAESLPINELDSGLREVDVVPATANLGFTFDGSHRDAFDRLIEEAISDLEDARAEAAKPVEKKKPIAKKKPDVEEKVETPQTRDEAEPVNQTETKATKIKPCGPSGECFSNVIKFFRKDGAETPDSRIIHGQVTNAEGKTFVHAWIEQGNDVIDPTQGLRMDKVRWYDLVSAKPETSFTVEQALVLSLRTGTPGPFTDAEIASMEGTKAGVPKTFDPSEKVDREKLKEGARRRQANFDPKNVILPPPGDVVGFVDFDDVTSAVKKGTSATKAFLQKYFTSRGDFPDAVFQRKIARDGNISRLINQARFTLRDFDRAAKEVYGGRKKMTPMDVARVDAVLKDEVDASTIPIEMREVVTRMRAEIDALSQALIDVGAIEGPLVARILENKGVYATRSYRIFTDPKWAQNVPLEIRNVAKDYIRRDNPKLTEDQAEARIERLLVIGEESDSLFALLKKGKLGSKDLSILKKRGDIPIEIRLLWGEHTDARVNYSQSILKMAHLLENHKFLTDVAENGLGKIFFDEPTIVGDQKFVTKIAADGSDALAPLNGLFTTLEIKKAFEDAGNTASYGFALRSYFKLNGIVKYSKTVLSLMTHIRNILGNTGFAMVHGHFKVWNAKKAIRTTLASLGAMDTKEYREFFLRMSELGVVDESARARELQDAIKDMSKLDADQFLGVNADKLANKISRTATGLYRAEDDVWKIFAFLHEEARYKKAFPEWTQDQVERKAAQIVRNTYPTYSLIPAVGKTLRRIPLGTFISFPMEVFRTTYKTLELINEERKDPRTRGIAAVRMAGVMAATSIVPAITAFSMFTNGLDDDDDEAYRQFMPPWSENSSILYLGKDENGDMEYIDLSYVDVYQYFRKPAIALMRGGNWKDAVIDAGVQASEPFLSPEIFAGKLIDVSVNIKNSTSKSPGGQIRNPADDFIKQGTDTLSHLYKAIEPGTLTSARRIAKGITGEVSVYGKTYDPVTESLAVFTGQRRSKVNIPQSLFFKTREVGAKLNNVSRIIGNVVRRRGTVTSEEIKKAASSYERARKEVIDQANLIYTSAIRMGMSTKDVKAEFRNRFSKEKMQEITTGVVQKNSWVSDLLYFSTNKSTGKETAERNIAAIKKFGLNRVQAERLLRREYKWRTLRKGDVPQRGTPRTDAYARRVRLLRKLF